MKLKYLNKIKNKITSSLEFLIELKKSKNIFKICYWWSRTNYKN